MKKLGRPKKERKIQKKPKIMFFSPRGRPGRPEEVDLSIDEYEALRIADYERHDQSKGAELLGLSRASFGRLLRDARRKIADALVNGKIIRISEIHTPFKYFEGSIPISV